MDCKISWAWLHSRSGSSPPRLPHRLSFRRRSPLARKLDKDSPQRRQPRALRLLPLGLALLLKVAVTVVVAVGLAVAVKVGESVGLGPRVML